MKIIRGGKLKSLEEFLTNLEGRNKPDTDDVIKISANFDISGRLLVKFYGDEPVYEFLVKDLKVGYFLQLKPYGHLYNLYFDKVKVDEKEIDPKEAEGLIQSDMYHKEEQFHLKDVDDVNSFPPFHAFEKHKESKFKTYVSNDKFAEPFAHVEDDNEHTDPASKFRMMDKLRIVSFWLRENLRLGYLSTKYLDCIYHHKVPQNYETDLSSTEIFLTSGNIFSHEKTTEFVHNLRNFYGENIAFYFMFIREFLLWNILPLVMGVTVFGLFHIVGVSSRVFQNWPIRYKDVILLLFCLGLVAWGKLIVLF